jgi:fructose transport system substrate-binding protein
MSFPRLRYGPSICLLLSLALLSAGPGCRRRKGDGPQGVKIGLALADGSPYAGAIRDHAQKLAKDREFELLVQDAGGKTSEQNRAIQQFLQQGASVVIVQPVDPAKLRPVLSRTGRPGGSVYFVTLERTVPDADIASFVEFDQELAGNLAADYLGHRLPAGGSVATITGPDTPDQEKRLGAFRAYLKQKHGNITVVGEASARYDADQEPAVQRLLKAHPDLGAIYALTDPLALAAAARIRAAPGARKPLVVGYGGLPQAIEELKKPDSPLAMTVTTFPQQLGLVGARQAWRIVSNKQAWTRVTLPVLPVTRDNAGTYPGWKQEVPRVLTVPWPSELKLEMARE